MGHLDQFPFHPIKTSGCQNVCPKRKFYHSKSYRNTRSSSECHSNLRFNRSQTNSRNERCFSCFCSLTHPGQISRVPLHLRANHASLPSPIRHRGLGQAGLIFAITLVPSLDSNQEYWVAIGSSKGSVGIYDLSILLHLAHQAAAESWNPHKIQQIETLGIQACVASWQVGLKGETEEAVTQIEILPCTPYVVAVTQRKTARILLYDLRYIPRTTGQVEQYDFTTQITGAALLAILSPSKPTGSSEKENENEENRTNQRLVFSIDSTGTWLASGSESDGKVHLWDLRKVLDAHGTIVLPDLSCKVHDDTVGVCTFHPFYPLLLTCAGSRHFDLDFPPLPPLPRSPSPRRQRNPRRQRAAEEKHWIRIPKNPKRIRTKPVGSHVRRCAQFDAYDLVTLYVIVVSNYGIYVETCFFPFPIYTL